MKRPYKPIADRLQALRKRTGETQEEMATRLGLSQTWMSVLNQGIKPPSDAVITRLTAEYGIAAEDWAALREQCRAECEPDGPSIKSELARIENKLGRLLTAAQALQDDFASLRAALAQSEDQDKP